MPCLTEVCEWIYGPNATDGITTLAISLRKKYPSIFFASQENTPRIADVNTLYKIEQNFTQDLSKSLEIDIPARLVTDSSRLKRFKDEFPRVIENLHEHASWLSKILNILVSDILPIEHSVKGNSPIAFSSHKAKGIVFISSRNTYETLSRDTIDLCHEIGHQALMILLYSDKIITSDPSILVFSGARKEPRPSYKSLHSAFALAYMISCEFHLPHKGKKAYCPKELRTALRMNVASLKKECEFTSFGKVLIDELQILSETHPSNASNG
tara:strand:+ start:298 stop:1104 length:807 start_codon:yes stop_codon:yes gene_type:complete